MAIFSLPRDGLVSNFFWFCRKGTFLVNLESAWERLCREEKKSPGREEESGEREPDRGLRVVAASEEERKVLGAPSEGSNPRCYPLTLGKVPPVQLRPS